MISVVLLSSKILSLHVDDSQQTVCPSADHTTSWESCNWNHANNRAMKHASNKAAVSSMLAHRSWIQGLASRATFSSSHASFRGQKKYSVTGLLFTCKQINKRTEQAMSLHRAIPGAHRHFCHTSTTVKDVQQCRKCTQRIWLQQ